MSGRKLYNTQKKLSNKLTESVFVPFVISFKYKLENGYGFEELQRNNLKELQSFLDKASNMSFDQVEKLYHRKNDSNDTYHDSQVVHYQVSDKFRIHGIIEDTQLVVIRLDPNHKFHK